MTNILFEKIKFVNLVYYICNCATCVIYKDIKINDTVKPKRLRGEIREENFFAFYE